MSREPRPDDSVTSTAQPDQGLWVYGVVDAELDMVEVRGVDREPIRLVRAGRIAAAVSSIVLDRPPGRKAELLAFQSVLDTLAAAGPVAPVRFGTIFPDEEAVAQFLEDRREEFERVLGGLRGRRQYILRATYVEELVLEEVVREVPEIRELRERTRDRREDASYGDRVRLGELVVHELERRGADDAAMLFGFVHPLAAAVLERSEVAPPTVMDAALLVDEADAERLVEVLEEVAEAVHERIRLDLTGPMAPYDFADGPSWAS